MTYAAVIVDNRDWVEPIIRQHEKFIPKDWPVYWIKNEVINNQHDYNKLLTSKRFWRVMPDKVLIFQHDSMLLRTGIEEFLEWDYVGAPWKFQEHGGNGGLSIRDKKAMLHVIDSIEWSPQLGNEDVYFCNFLIAQSASKLAPREVCEKFSCESIFKLGTLGYHAIDKYLTPEQVTQIKCQYQ